MYTLSTRDNNELLSTESGVPSLIATDPFCKLLSTLPDGCELPMSVIKLGLLTEHLEPKPDGLIVDVGAINLDSTAAVTLPARTYAAIEWLLYNHCETLSQGRKKQIGKLCESAELDKPNGYGVSEADVRNTLPGPYNQHPASIMQEISPEYECEYCGKGFDSVAARNGHLANCDERSDASGSESSRSSSKESSGDSRPALGKEIRKDRGSERVSGRNPFADPDRIKDTGLHQGGGS